MRVQASGDWHFRAWNRECKWRGNGENPGELVCQDERFGCFKAENAATKDDCPEDIKETESLNCAFDSDGDATKFVGGTCTVRWWYDYNAAIVIGGKTKLRIEGIWDNASNNIGGAWGHAEAGDVIKNDQKVSRLRLSGPHRVTVTDFCASACRSTSRVSSARR